MKQKVMEILLGESFEDKTEALLRWVKHFSLKPKKFILLNFAHFDNKNLFQEPRRASGRESEI